MAKVTLISNRLPVSVKKVNGRLKFVNSDGGLATGLASYANRRGTKWIGWPGIVSEDLTEAERKIIAQRLVKRQCYPVFLTKKQVEHFYNKYSNSVIWPFFHNLKMSIVDSKQHWKTYQEVNQVFADAALALSDPRSTIWIHDYHFMLVPSMLREQRPYDSIGFFLHTPFPASKHFVKLPQARKILRGLLGADVVGLHTREYVSNFLDSCHDLGLGVISGGSVAIAERVIRVANFPISIDYAKYADASSLPEIKQHVRRLKREYGRYKIILAFDRLDITKGFIERLNAYRQLLEQNPKLHKKVMLLMIAAPSRMEVAAYQKLQQDIELLAQDINHQFGDKDWQPVVFIFRSIDFEEVSALYQVADVAFITPLRDGMNLMAKEYVASQKNKNGVLILSQTAGAAEELTDALLVNPLRPETLVNALQEALNMTPRELSMRIAKMQDHLANHTVQHWAGNFMRTLRNSPAGLTTPTKHLSARAAEQIADQFKSSETRLIFLDYDGVLMPFKELPEEAKPTAAIYKLLNRLGNLKGTEVVIISGRSQANLEEWFGDLPVNIIAEHGIATKKYGHKWPALNIKNTEWKEIIKPVLEEYAEITPGAFVEEKNASLVWHFRRSPAYYAQKHSVLIKRVLKPLLKTNGLGIYSGNRILEIKPRGFNKGISAKALMAGAYADFILAIGDDYTDEDMFRSLPDSTWTIKVGSGRTAARFRAEHVEDVLALLKSLR